MYYGVTVTPDRTDERSGVVFLVINVKCDT
jgi:hypothetical protein